jgi:hypothetical protein
VGTGEFDAQSGCLIVARQFVPTQRDESSKLRAKNKVEGAVRYAAQTTHKKSLMHVNLIKQAEQSRAKLSFPFGSGENLPVASDFYFAY